MMFMVVMCIYISPGVIIEIVIIILAIMMIYYTSVQSGNLLNTIAKWVRISIVSIVELCTAN